MKNARFLYMISFFLVLLCGVTAVFAEEEPGPIRSASFNVENQVESEYLIQVSSEKNPELTEGSVSADVPDAEDLEAVCLNKPDETITDEEIPPYTIFYPDDRQIVYYSPTNQPFNNVTRITYDQGTCSGFMIGPNYVATAAHCLYNEKTKKWNSNFYVCPSYSKGNSPYGCAGAKQLWVLDTGIYRPYDVGVIQLTRDIGRQSGWLGHWVISDGQTDDYAMMLGYASDKNMDYMFYTYDHLKGTSENGKLLVHRMDCLPGFSGGPMIMPYKGEWLYVVGINVAYSSDYNYSVRLTQTVMDFLDDFWGK